MMTICGPDGMWSPDPATHMCSFDCGPPPTPRNGSLESYTDTTEGSEVFYRCDQGLVPEMRMMTMCTGTGWNPNPGAISCSAVNCGMPIGPRNGFIEQYQSTLGGAEIFFMCAPGFDPAGRMRANCTSDGITVDGTWTPDPATLMCNVNCGMPTGPRNGFIEVYQNTPGGAEIFFICAPGFVPAGRMRANCTSDGVTVDGTWNPDPATLICNASTVDCGDPNNASSEVIVQYSSTRVSSVIFYQCRQSGFAPSSSSAVCMESGRWSPAPSQVACGMVTMTLTPTGGMYTPDRNLPPSAVTAITTVVCSLVMFITGALCGAVVTVCISRWGDTSKPASKIQEQQQTVAVYEEVDTPSQMKENVAYGPGQKIEMKENVAYGPVKVH